MKRASRTRKIAIAIGAGGIAGGVLAASAASLGTLSVQNLGATNTIVQACTSSGIQLTSWGTPTYSVASSVGFFTMNQVTLSGIGTCGGRPFALVIANSAGTSLASTTGNLANVSSTVLTVAPSFNVESATQATLTIY